MGAQPVSFYTHTLFTGLLWQRRPFRARSPLTHSPGRWPCRAGLEGKGPAQNRVGSPGTLNLEFSLESDWPETVHAFSRPQTKPVPISGHSPPSLYPSPRPPRIHFVSMDLPMESVSKHTSGRLTAHILRWAFGSHWTRLSQDPVLVQGSTAQDDNSGLHLWGRHFAWCWVTRNTV